eukprot:TRINITY_DN11475_c0_g1_i1.p1 TRINITY_DN11475_c0_g1~~TRINITY_DN11475_c0_g1_i1.p1  ORF type:complete len:881 (-),score=129.49 TRINITY_DN11475_c0_g1_i1:20-2662(-)
MSSEALDGPGGLLAALPRELIAAILTDGDNTSAYGLTYDLALMISASCSFWMDPAEQARLFYAVTSVALRSPVAAQKFAREKFLPSLKHLYVCRADRDLSTWAALGKIAGLYSPQLETFSFLWLSEETHANTLAISWMVQYPWPNLKTLEARVGSLTPQTPDGSEFGTWAFENRPKSMFKAMPMLRCLRVCLVNNETPIAALRDALDVCKHRLEELMIKTYKDPLSNDMLKHPSPTLLHPGDSELVYSHFKFNDFPNLRCFATSHLPTQLSSSVISPTEPLRANIWSIQNRTSAIGEFLVNFGLGHLPPNPILPDFNDCPARLNSNGGILALHHILKSRDITIEELDVIVGLGADPWARCWFNPSWNRGLFFHGNIFTFALLETGTDGPFEKIFRKTDTSGLTFFQKAIARYSGEWSIRPTGSPSILHDIADFPKRHYLSLESRIEWMIQNSDELKIDLNVKNKGGLAFVHRCVTPRIFNALLMSGRCVTDANDSRGRGALECAIAMGEGGLASSLYQRRSVSVGLPLPVFLAAVEVAYSQVYYQKKSSKPTPSAAEHVVEPPMAPADLNDWTQLAEMMYRDAMPQMRLAPIDQLDPLRIKQFCFVFGTTESNRSLPWSRMPYRHGETHFEAILRIAMGRFLAEEGLRCLKALLEDPNVHATDLVPPSKKGYTALHVLAEADLCSLIDGKSEAVSVLDDVINLLLQKGIDPLAETPSKKTALDLALEKKIFPPTELAMSIFLKKLVPGMAEEEQFHEPAQSEDHSSEPKWSSLLHSQKPVASGWDDDDDPELRRALMMSMEEAKRNVATNPAPNVTVSHSYSYADDYNYDEEAMMRKALAMSLEDVRPASATASGTTTSTETQGSFFPDDEDSDLESVAL